MAFAEPTDVEIAYEGSLPDSAQARIQYLLDVVSARLRTLLPDLEARIEAEEIPSGQVQGDLALLAKDVVVQVVLRRLPGGASQQVRSETQAAGPYSTTRTYTTDISGTFSDEDLAALRGGSVAGGPVGTIKMGTLVAWHDQ